MISESQNLVSTRAEESATPSTNVGGRKIAEFLAKRVNLVYLVSLSLALLTWLIPIRQPLWLDETFSYWQIQGGLSEIWARSSAWPCSPIYPYILWLTEKIAGHGEGALRIPSFLAMVGAVYFLYRTTNLLFEHETALITAILFSINPDVAFAAVDARSYAFAMLAVTLASYLLVTWTRSGRSREAVFLGITCGWILYFQYLYAVVFPAFFLYFIFVKRNQLKSAVRGFGIVTISFLISITPLIPHVVSLVRAKDAHSFSPVPDIHMLLSQLAPKPLSTIVLWTVLIAAAISKIRRSSERELPGAVLGLVIAIIPCVILYDVSVSTSLQVFLARYVLVAVPGIALCWAWLLSLVNSRVMKVLAVMAVVLIGISNILSVPPRHSYSWKTAIGFTRVDVARDHAPVLMCSDYVESDTHALPGSPVTDSAFVSQVSYYTIGEPVRVLPRELTEYSKSAISSFLEGEASHKRFVVLAFKPSYPTIHWLKEKTQNSHSEHYLGVFDGVFVVEFLPR